MTNADISLVLTCDIYHMSHLSKYSNRDSDKKVGNPFFVFLKGSVKFTNSVSGGMPASSLTWNSLEQIFWAYVYITHTRFFELKFF